MLTRELEVAKLRLACLSYTFLSPSSFQVEGKWGDLLRIWELLVFSDTSLTGSFRIWHFKRRPLWNSYGLPDDLRLSDLSSVPSPHNNSGTLNRMVPDRWRDLESELFSDRSEVKAHTAIHHITSDIVPLGLTPRFSLWKSNAHIEHHVAWCHHLLCGRRARKGEWRPRSKCYRIKHENKQLANVVLRSLLPETWFSTVLSSCSFSFWQIFPPFALASSISRLRSCHCLCRATASSISEGGSTLSEHQSSSAMGSTAGHGVVHQHAWWSRSNRH